MEKNIHQIWVGPYILPDKEKCFLEKIKTNHPDFKHFFWNNENIPELPENLYNLLHEYQTEKIWAEKRWVFIADMLRYYIINEYGGLYIDCDYELLNTIHDLNLEKYDGFLPLHFNVGETICNSIFGFKRKHPLMNYVCENISQNKRWLGPHFFGKCVKNYLKLNEEEPDDVVKIKLEEINIKVIHSRKVLGEKYLKHHLSYTWHPLNQEKMKINNEFRGIKIR